jgi:hypothetical protein
MQRALRVIVVVMCAAAAADAQTPQPFPRPGTQAQPQRPATPPPAAPAAPRPGAAAPTPQPPAAPDSGAPTAATLGVAIYPAAQFLASYDAGLGQRYYLFGTTATFLDVIGYYRTQTGEKGDDVYKDPPTHMFTGGPLPKYRDETMAFPPSVTVKDWTAGGSTGYPNPKLGAQPARFPTIIMIVPAPPGTPVR